MSHDRWQAIRLDEVEPITVADGVRWKPVRRLLGVQAFGINAYAAARAGDPVVERHTEEQLGHEETYVVLTGHASFTLDGETVDAPAGSIVFVRDPAVRREAHAVVDGTTVLAVGAKPGEAYAPSAWETFFHAERHRPAGDFEAMAVELEAALDHFPDHPAVLYNLACAEARAGRTSVALEHLGRSLELDPRQRSWAEQDDDLASLRGLPGYPAAP